jgi:hypothetical protein
MYQTYRSLYCLALIFGCSIGSALVGGEVDETVAGTPFIGTWRVTSATNTVIVDIKPGGEALFILIQRGSNAVEKVSWNSMAGGIVVDSLPRFRFWAGRTQAEVRAEMEPLPAAMTEASLQQFPLAFFMHRVDARRADSRAVRERSLPPHWADESLPAEWDQAAGQRRVENPSPPLP